MMGKWRARWLRLLDAMRDYELNSEVAWDFSDDPPEKGRPFFGLIETDTCDPTEYPGVLLMVREQDGRYRLLDFDPENQEEYLRTNSYCIQAFRYMTNHAGTWDKHFAEHPDDACFKDKEV